MALSRSPNLIQRGPETHASLNEFGLQAQGFAQFFDGPDQVAGVQSRRAQHVMRFCRVRFSFRFGRFDRSGL